jgi:hypothetical protein
MEFYVLLVILFRLAEYPCVATGQQIINNSHENKIFKYLISFLVAIRLFRFIASNYIDIHSLVIIGTLDTWRCVM